MLVALKVLMGSRVAWAAAAVFVAAISTASFGIGYHRGTLSTFDKALDNARQLGSVTERHRAADAEITRLGEDTRIAKERAKKLQAEARVANAKLGERINNVYTFKSTADQCLDVENLINQELQK